MRLAILVAVVALLAMSAAVTPTARAAPTAAKSLAALGKEYQRLRKVAGWFSNGGKDWNDAADSADGRKAVVMGQLGTLLGDGKHTRRQVLQFMGKPDRVAHDGDMAFGLANPPAGTTEVLVYEWRGIHDFLWFAVVGKQVTKSGWWMAYE